MITWEIDKQGIALLKWDIPGRSTNVVNPESLESFSETVASLVANDNVKGVIICSLKSDFIVGGDLGAFASLESQEKTLDYVAKLQRCLRLMETGGKPFVAAINGSALGPGLEIALACHYRIASENPRSLLGLPEVLLGLLPGAGGSQRLPRMIGLQAASTYLLEGRKVRVHRALHDKIIDRVVPPDALLQQAKAWILANPAPSQAWDVKGFKMPGGGVLTPKGSQFVMAGNALIRKKTWGNFPALEALMSCLYEGALLPFEQALALEAKYFAKVAASKEAKQLVRSLFFSRLAANKLERRPSDLPKQVVKKLGILGAGMMGAGIAYSAAAAGIKVVLLDVDEAAAKQGKAFTIAKLKARVARNRLTIEQAEHIAQFIHPSNDYKLLSDCDCVIEAVIEDIEVKHQVNRDVTKIISKDCLYASNTSKLSISKLGESVDEPGRFLGLHFFSPVDKMPLVEVIRGKDSDDKAIAKGLDLVRQLNKTPIVVNDSRGFFTTRVFEMFVCEGLIMLAEGVKPALIENAARLAGMPVGPLALADEVSLTLLSYVMKQGRAELKSKYIRTEADDVVDLFVDKLERFGKKHGAGFYEYTQSGDKYLWHELSTYFPLQSKQPLVQTLKDRFLFIQSLEAARAMDEGVVTDPRDADLGSLLGLGYPTFTGGCISYIDGYGVPAFVKRAKALEKANGNRFAPPKLLQDMVTAKKSFYLD